MLHIITAMTAAGVIGQDNALPWDIPEEKHLFRLITMGHPVIVGRKTFQSFGHAFPGRPTIVMSRQGPNELSRLSNITGAHLTHSMPEALRLAASLDKKIFIIGGADVYRQFLPVADYLHISWITEDYPGNIMFPPVNWAQWHLTEDKSFAQFTYRIYKK